MQTPGVMQKWTSRIELVRTIEAQFTCATAPHELTTPLLGAGSYRQRPRARLARTTLESPNDFVRACSGVMVFRDIQARGDAVFFAADMSSRHVRAAPMRRNIIGQRCLTRC
jgi:hypothetical protein